VARALPINVLLFIYFDRSIIDGSELGLIVLTCLTILFVDGFRTKTYLISQNICEKCPMEARKCFRQNVGQFQAYICGRQTISAFNLQNMSAYLLI
jgi:hypothetical protein